jgi:[DsrC]-trisulfide reductase subunit O
MSHQSEQQQTDLDRREFLGRATAAVAAMAVVPGVFMIKLGNARPLDQGVSNKVRWGMLIDTTKCATGCDSCVRACNEENGLRSTGRPETDAQWIRKVRLRDKQTGFVQSLPLMCQHCENPPCVDVCPTGASFKRADGIVLVDKHICIGCRYCMMACPYKARSFVSEEHEDQVPQVPRGKGCVESCTFCVQRVDAGRTPACVEACNAEHHGAMVFGDLNDPESEVARKLKSVSSRELRQDMGLNTGVRYQGI